MREIVVLLLLVVCLVHSQKSQPSIVQSLSGEWKLTNSNSSITTTGTVPGYVHTDLLSAGIISDPYYRYNDVDYRWIYLDDWSYLRSFQVSSNLLNQQMVFLECDGIDTIAEIKINGKSVVSTMNMFVQYRVEVSSFLVAGTNYISVSFTSAASYVQARNASYPYPIPYSPVFPTLTPIEFPNRNFVRKEQSSFAWNWAPCYLPQGIYKDIRIVGYNELIPIAVVPQLYNLSSTGEYLLTVNARFTLFENHQISMAVNIGKWTAKVTSTLNSGDVKLSADILVNQSDVNLWWPVGYGSPNLYNLSVTLSTSNFTLPPIVQNFGFRFVEIITKPIANGETFYFQINGIPVFAKGANFVPADSWETRVTDEIIESLVGDAVSANMNVLRVWGGGVYQSDHFYDVADRLGIMVWQEFMFACAMYPTDPAFLESVKQEVAYQVTRLQGHPSIILWGGNNENELALAGWYPIIPTNQFLYGSDYSTLYLNTIYPTLRSIDTQRPFWGSSPSNGFYGEDGGVYMGKWGNPDSNYYGDVHYYNDGFDCTDRGQYPDTRFASEFGFYSYPSIYTYEPVIEPSDWVWDSPLMVHRQHYLNGTAKVQAQIMNHFQFPNNTNSTESFLSFIYLSQCAQAFCVKSQTEHFRRGKGNPLVQTMGAIYWMLNDIWQAPSRASIEYGGRWKVSHYFAKRFFAPVLISSNEYPTNSYSAYVTSDLLQPLTGKAMINLWTYEGKIVNSWGISVNIPVLGSELVFNQSVSSMLANNACNNDRTKCFVELSVGNSTTQVIASNYYFFTSLAQVTLPRPNVTIENVVQTSTNTISFTVTSFQVSPYTFIETSYSGHFSDNGMILYPFTPLDLSFTSLSLPSIQLFKSSLVVRTVISTLSF